MTCFPRCSLRVSTLLAQPTYNSRLRSSRKRSNSTAQLEQSTNQARKKKTLKKRLDYFPLMQLPTEIRLQILRELLWQQASLRTDTFVIQQDRDPIDPITFVPGNSFSFCPEILRACRQLYQEGEPILYENTFGCIIWCDEETMSADIYRSALLCYGWDIVQRDPRRDRHSGFIPCMPTNMMSKIKKIDLSVYISDTELLLEARTGVRNFIKGCRFLRDLSHLNVDVQLDLDRLEDLDQTLVDFYCRNVTINFQELLDLAISPLGCMRRLRYVKISGVSEDLAIKLASNMTQKGHITDLPRMMDALHQYTFKIVEWGHCGDCNIMMGYLSLAERAVDLHDLEMFKLIRENILSLIDEHQDWAKREVSMHDPIDEAGRSYNQDGKPIPEAAVRLWQEGSMLDSDDDFEDDFDDDFDVCPEYEDIETESIRQARQSREKLDPLLRKLRDIWQWEESDEW